MSLIIQQIWDRVCKSDREKLAVCYYKGRDESYRVTYGFFRAAVTLAQGLVQRLTENRRQYILFFGEATHASICLLLGILKGSSAFVCLDPKSDGNNLKRIIEKLNVQWILSNVSSEILSDYDVIEEDFWLCGESFSVLWTGTKFENSLQADFVYAIQTSGSTGHPKLVQVPSECILPNILDLSQKLNVQPNDVIAQSTPLTFDPSLVELFLAFANGATLVVLSPSVKLDPEALTRVVQESGINFYQTTPSIFNNWPTRLKNELLSGHKPKLKTLVLGGERFDVNKITVPLSADVNIYNIYGITEVSCWASLKKVWPNDHDGGFESCVDIGSPLSETIFDLIKYGEDSDLYNLRIGSKSRCCVIDDEELSIQSKEPVFRVSGDLFKVIDGKLFYQGRVDSLVKRLGHRVSLDFIETALSEIGLKGVCCMSNDNGRLCLFVEKQKTIGHDDQDDSLVRSLIKSKLAKYLWPDCLYFVSHFPVTAHGKIDKKTLLDQQRFSNENIRASFRRLWVHFASDGDLDFLSSGGNSFAALQLIEGLRLENLIVPEDFIVDLLNGSSYSHCVSKIFRFNESFDCEDCVKKPTLKRALDLDVNEESLKLIKKQRTWIRFKGNLKPDALSDSEIEEIRSWTGGSLEMKTAWTQNLKKCVDSSPLGVLFDELCPKTIVIACSHAGLIAVLDIEHGGRLVSEIKLPNRIESSACLSSDEEHFYIGCYDSNLYKIDVNSGRTVWNFKTGDIIKCTAVLQDFLIYFGSYDNYIYCISEEGKEKWKTKISGPILAQILPHDGCVFASSINGRVYCLDSKTGDISWEFQISPSFTNLKIVNRNLNDELMACDVQGNVTVLNLTTGEQSFKLELKDQIFATPVISTKTSVLLLAAGSTLHCHQGDLSFTRIWSRKFPSRIVSTPFVFDGYILLAVTNGTLNLVRVNDGEILTTHRLDGEIFSSPIFIKSQIFVGCRDNFLYCVNIKTK